MGIVRACRSRATQENMCLGHPNVAAIVLQNRGRRLHTWRTVSRCSCSSSSMSISAAEVAPATQNGQEWICWRCIHCQFLPTVNRHNFTRYQVPMPGLAKGGGGRAGATDRRGGRQSRAGPRATSGAQHPWLRSRLAGAPQQPRPPAVAPTPSCLPGGPVLDGRWTLASLKEKGREFNPHDTVGVISRRCR